MDYLNSPNNENSMPTFEADGQDWSLVDPNTSIWGDNTYGVADGGGLAGLLGFQGSAYTNNSPEQDTATMNPEFRAFLDSKYGPGWKMGTQTNDETNVVTGGLFDSAGKQQLSRQWMMPDDSGDFAAIVSTLSPMITGGINQINPGRSFFDNPLTQKIFNTALGNAGMSAATGGNPITGAVQGAVSAGVPGMNLGQQVGIESPGIQNIFNRGVSGGINSALAGGDPIQGAVSSAAPAALGTAFQSLSGGNKNMMNFDYGSSAPGYLDQMIGRTSVPYQPLGDAGVVPQQSMPEMSIPGYNTEATSVPNQQTMATQAGISQPPSQAPAWAQGLSGIFGIYSALDNMNRNRKLFNNLNGMFGSGGSYAKQLRQKLERQDAARGRRSDYAGRQTQLDAALAQGQMSVAPALANIGNAQNQGLMSLFNNALKLGTNEDLGNWLGGLFKG